MPAMQITSTININAPAAHVRDTIADFTTWPKWSPWLLMEPECNLTYQGNAGELGHGYDWKGDKIGAGGMVVKSLDANRMEADLQFLKPWKSQADIAFDIEAIGKSQTLVKWHMDSSMPFFMFFMVNKMKAMIKNDYDRGLRMLKDYLETGSVPTGTNVEGVVDVPAVLYAGKSYQSSMADIGESMGKAFPEVFNAATAASAEVVGMPFSIYNKMDLVNSACSYTAAIPVANSVTLSEGVQCSERPTCRALKVVHTGPYRHLGNAWSTGMSEMRYLKLKMDKLKPPFEVYVNDPEHTAEAALITEIYMPVRG